MNTVPLCRPAGLVLTLALGALVAGCGSGSDGAAAAMMDPPAPPAQSAETPPAIEGHPQALMARVDAELSWH